MSRAADSLTAQPSRIIGAIGKYLAASLAAALCLGREYPHRTANRGPQIGKANGRNADGFFLSGRAAPDTEHTKVRDATCLPR